MKFFDYLDVTFRNESKQSQLEGFTVFRDAKIKATYAMVGWWRTFWKYINVPLILLDYFAVQLKLHPEPVPPAIEPTTTVPPSPAAIKEMSIN